MRSRVVSTKKVNVPVSLPCILSHWSLLVFRRAADGAAGKFEHYDSCKGGNAVHARAVARCMVTLLQPGVGGATVQMVAMQTPQQVPAPGTPATSLPRLVAEIICSTSRGDAAEVRRSRARCSS